MRRAGLVSWRFAVFSLALAAGCGPGPGGAGGEGDAAAGAGPVATATACTALRPSFSAAPVELLFSTGTHTICSHGTTSPAGQVALGFQSTGGTGMELYSSSGVPQPNPAASIHALQPYGFGYELDPWFHWTSTGWAGIVHQPPPALGFMTWDASGNTLAVVQDFNASASAPDARGGSVVIAWDLAAGPHLLWVSAAGQVTRDARIDRNPVALIVNWATGHVLVVSDEGTSRALARWFDGGGAPLTGWFTTHVAVSGRPTLRLLRDGRQALYTGGQWVAAFHDGQTIVDRAPAWLTSRPGTRLALIPGGYAVLSDGALPGQMAPDSPAPRLEILNAAGASCGYLSPPPAPQPVGGSRRPYAFFLGQDGTLLEGSELSGTSPELQFGIHCAFRWWPRLFSPR